MAFPSRRIENNGPLLLKVGLLYILGYTKCKMMSRGEVKKRDEVEVKVEVEERIGSGILFVFRTCSVEPKRCKILYLE
jgi:hypothetical protein